MRQPSVTGRDRLSCEGVFREILCMLTVQLTRRVRIEGISMILHTAPPKFFVLVFSKEVRDVILCLLRKREYPCVEVDTLEDLLGRLVGIEESIVFIGSDAVMAYGAGIAFKLKTSCRGCKLILLCSLAHRKIIKSVMDLGAYGCIVEPYPEWEIVSMIKPILIDPRLERGTVRTPRPGSKRGED